MIIIYMVIVLVIVFLIISKKEQIEKIGVDDGTLVEIKLDKDVIPTTRKWGIWGSIISGVGLIISTEFLSGIIVIIIGISTTIGFVILLEGFSTIIKLLRKLSDK